MATQNAQNPPLQKRFVVSTFIFRVPKAGQGKPAVALFRRSEKVRTYRHHLAPIAGSVDREDKSPLKTAWRELAEETTLTPASLDLWRKGKPYTFSDVSVGREWTIYPFAFRLKEADEGGAGEEGIKTDWEHEGWQWFDPDTVSDDEPFGGVPRLRESLRRVWFEGEMNEAASTALAAGLRKLQLNHLGGSRELTAVALTVFREIVTATHNGIDDQWWNLMRMTVWHLWKNGRESMGTSTINALLSVLADMDGIVKQDIGHDQKWERMLAMVDLHVEDRKSMTTGIRDSFTSYIRSNFLSSDEARSKITILTVSASSTIRDSIIDAYASLDIKTLELRILESRPLFEGVSIASSLLSQFKSQFQNSPDKNLEINVYTDASAALAATDVDMVLLGADRISAEKGVSNKTGSLPTVLSVKHAAPNAKILVLSELEKVEGQMTSSIEENIIEENDPMEIISGWYNDGVKGIQILKDSITETKTGRAGNAKIAVKNVYFEWAPLTLVDAFISEEGVLKPEMIRDKSRQVSEKMDKYLNCL